MSTSTNGRLLEAARRYNKKGWRPSAVLKDGASVKSWTEIRDRETDPTDKELARWFAKKDVIGVRIPTGPETGVIAIDIDHKKGEDGFSALEDLAGLTVEKDLRGPTIHSPTRDGIHVLFKHPGNGARVPSGKILPGVEVKGDGSNIVLDSVGSEWDEKRNLTNTTLPQLKGVLKDLVLAGPREDEDQDDDVELDVPPWDEGAPLPPLEAAIPEEGYLANVVSFFNEATDVPPEYALSVGIAQLSALMAGRMATEAWGDLIRSHLWIVFVSGPATRKTHAWKLAIRILKGVDSDLQIPSDSTVPALIKYLSEEREDEPAGYIFHSEMKRFLESCQQSWQAGTQDFMSELFDSLDDVGELRVTREANEVHNPSVSIMGALTDAGFAKYAKTSAILDGYLTRFVFIFRESSPIKGRGIRAGQVGGSRSSALTKELKSRYRLIRKVAGKEWPYTVPMTDTAATTIDEYSDRLKDESVDRGVEGFRDRVVVQVLKLAMAYAASRAAEPDDFEIRRADVRHAIAFMDYQRAVAWPAIALAAETQTRTAEYRMALRVKIQELQRRQAAANGSRWAEEWVTKRNLQRSMKDMSSKALDGYLETLQVAGEVRLQEAAAKRGQYKGGRPSTRVRLMPAGWVRSSRGLVT